MKASGKLLNCIDNLPGFPKVLFRIRSIATDPRSTLTDLVQAIKTDPIFTARLLRLANSAYIGLPNSVSSVHNAVVLLGRKRIAGLAVISYGLQMSVDAPRVFSLRNFWRHCLAVGILSESIARHCLRYEAIDAEELFTAGTLHDIGMLVLAHAAPEHVRHIAESAGQAKRPFFALEPHESSHQVMGMVAARQWRLPEVLAHTIRYHHTPLESEVNSRQVAIVHLADSMAKMVGLTTLENDAVVLPEKKAMALIPLPDERLRVIARKALEDQKEIESLIDALF
ncbi:MAG: HDOD domain-containing protein [Chitinivibrionales bacterium]